ncbi:MAG: glycine cleavage system protein GcvH [Pseudomonadota bacterium]
MSETLRYAKSHEWAQKNDDGVVTIGISEYAQDALGDVVYVELPEVGQQVTAGEQCSVVESVKAVSDIYAPVSGEVVAINEGLDDEPELINESPLENGWMFKVKMSDASEHDNLLSAADYAAEIADE